MYFSFDFVSLLSSFLGSVTGYNADLSKTVISILLRMREHSRKRSQRSAKPYKVFIARAEKGTGTLYIFRTLSHSPPE